jgi:GntR family transcriptional regulator
MSPLPLRIDPRSALPIWSQIEEGIRHLVAMGRLAPGGAVPSVRDLARELRINPATVSKAYQRLTDIGVLEVRRGEGTYVTSQPPALATRERQQILREGARRFTGLAATLGLSRNETVAEIDAAWAELSDAGKEDKEPREA